MAEADVQNEELPLESAGSRLRRAREAAGLSLGDIAARTKIAERHLASIEQSRFSALASRTYAVGFARAYARTIGLDERGIAQAVRDELAASESAGHAPKVDVFEPGDPARVPGSRLAWLASLGALAVIVLVAVFWRSFYSPAVSLPDLTAPRESTAATTPAPKPGFDPLPGPSAPVVFTALEPDIWVKFYDAAGAQLMQKQMARGESYTVPADANGPLIRTARPDALQITIAGRIVPRLSEKSVSVKDVPVSAAALLARTAPTAAQVAPAPSAAPLPSAAPPVAIAPSPSPRPTAAAAAATPSPRPTAAPERPRPAPSPLSSPPAAAAPKAPSSPTAAAETSTVSN